MKYHFKTLGTTKTQGFLQNRYGYELFLHPLDETYLDAVRGLPN